MWEKVVRAADPAVTRSAPTTEIGTLRQILELYARYSHKCYCHGFALQKDQHVPMGVRGRMKRGLEELWRLEQICLAEAAPATMHIERIGLLKVAEDCRRSADEIEARAALQSRARSFLGVSWGYPGYADTNWPGHVGVRSDRLGAVRRALSSLVSRSRVHHKGPPVHAGGFLSLTLNAAEGPSVYRTGDSFADRRCFMDLTW